MRIIFTLCISIFLFSCHPPREIPSTNVNSVHGYLGSYLVYYLNLRRDQWQASDNKPIVPFRKAGGSGIGNNERIPFVTYYAPHSATGTGFLSTLMPEFIIQLDNNSVVNLIPNGIIEELGKHKIAFADVQILVTIGILPEENEGDPPIRQNPLSLFPHNWVHDEIKPETNLSINVAQGLYEAHGVNVNSDDIKNNGPIGIDNLATYGAYIHPSGMGRSGFSSRQALFQLDPNKDVVDFFSLSIDVDDKSPHKNSAIIMYQIIFSGETRHKIRESEFFKLVDASIEERDKALEKWYEELKAKSIPSDTVYFPPNFPSLVTAKDICDKFTSISIKDTTDISRIATKLRRLFGLEN